MTVPFSYVRVQSVDAAQAAIAQTADARFVAGGTNLVDLMRVYVMQPSQVIDINHLDEMRKIENQDSGGMRVGALVTNTELASHPIVREHYPMLSAAILSGASQQLRNRATTAGNMMQRTRCPYYRSTEWNCNRRVENSGCSAREGETTNLAILGVSDKCLATHASDMSVALAALDVTVNVAGPKGQRTIAFKDFHKLPGDTPSIEYELKPDEIVTSIDIAPSPVSRVSTYYKLRERTSYAFALSSVAAALDVKNGTITDARIALGGVATVPWRSREAEQALIGAKADAATYAKAADAALASAKTTPDNAFKVALAKNAIVAVLTDLGARS